MKKFHKKITLGLIFFLVFIFINLIFVSQTVYGAPRIIEFKPQIPIPGGIEGQTAISPVINDGVLQSNLLSRYIKSLYDYGIAVAGILAAIVMMGGGVLWLTSGGSENRISQAKDLIFGSVIGLGLVFSSWIILNTVNPDLLNFNTIGLTTVPKIEEILICNSQLREISVIRRGATYLNANNEIVSGDICGQEKECVRIKVVNGEPVYGCAEKTLIKCCEYKRARDVGITCKSISDGSDCPKRNTWSDLQREYKGFSCDANFNNSGRNPCVDPKKIN